MYVYKNNKNHRIGVGQKCKKVRNKFLPVLFSVNLIQHVFAKILMLTVWAQFEGIHPNPFRIGQ